ncbi:cation-translocating P-type ATPase [Caenimonas koreensis]|uniref:Heavy metal translocating P-type ATPase n=1 Tax=Caenimonas koreensis DSM 17982 TaxID=1121255 RepID=A0A844B3U0_9BURK|nr:heavy metal translocating P-type ATPase [Caenimonas koreensis]MRD47892.1 heavy metal translocating P-type ATPase [Caenimonas koreensis DSM 17982]
MPATAFAIPPAQSSALPWAALDDAAEWQSFSRPLNSAGKGSDDLQESFLSIEGMHCATCSLAVEEALLRVDGVSCVQVNGATATARIEWSPQVARPSSWLAALKQAGYGAVPAADLLDSAPRDKERRVLLWRWLVAGFCMMQVMMYAVPAYVAPEGEITPDIVRLLGWASWVLTLPVVLFSCWPFFASALRDMRNRVVGMDVPVALGIAIAFGASSVATFDPASPLGHEVWFDSVTMFVFFLLSGRILEQRLRDKTAGSLEALMRRLPPTTLRRNADGLYERVAVRRLAAGDVVQVLPGEAFPADGVVLEGQTRADEALLTGESSPVLRRVGDAVIAGTHNLIGAIVMRVDRAGRETRYAEIVALMERAAMEKPRLAQLADRIAGPFMLFVLLAAAAAAAWWWPDNPARAIGVAIAVLIVTCPCALSLATPAATLAAAGALARRGVLVRRLQALEACASIDLVAFDKTGTLTQDRMGLSATHVRPGFDARMALDMAAALARHSLHPASRAIVAATVATPWVATGTSEVAGSGVRGDVSSPLFPQPRAMRLGSALLCGAGPESALGDQMQVHLADSDGWLATFDLDETMRPDAEAAVGELRSRGMQVELLSGDRDAAVRRLAARAGIAAAHGSCTPADKLARVQAAQREGHHVLMAGDGVNDGPVLAAANVSVAMGQGAPLAQARSDFIVPGGQLRMVPALVRHAQRTRSVVRQNLAWAAGYNAVCVPLAIAGAMPPWLAGLGMAASSLLVVANSARLARMED